MTYNSNDMKKLYRKKYDAQRGENLKRLRTTFTDFSQANFIKKVNFTKSDISNLESGDKVPSLYHINAYKCFFKENYNIDVSVDYLMGYTSIVTNDNMKTEKEIGLSDKAIDTLKSLKDEYFPAMDVLNFVLSKESYFLSVFFNLSLYFNDFLYHDFKPVHYDVTSNSWIPNTLPKEFDADEKYKASMTLGFADTNGYKPIFFEIDELNAYALYKLQKVFEMIKKEYNEGNDANETT